MSYKECITKALMFLAFCMNYMYFRLFLHLAFRETKVGVQYESPQVDYTHVLKSGLKEG